MAAIDLAFSTLLTEFFTLLGPHANGSNTGISISVHSPLANGQGRGFELSS